MDNRSAYDQWAKNYDQMQNKTRDLEAGALRSLLEKYSFSTCLEIGCGTGKNTQWLATKAEKLTAVDFSEEMMARARAKQFRAPTDFVVADVTKDWSFTSSKYDLVSFSLILEHIEDLHHIFSETSKVLAPGGLVYIGELHPYKQYKGSKARFGSAEGEHTLDCHTHHISDYISAAHPFGLQLVELEETFSEGGELPQILSLVLRKS